MTQLIYCNPSKSGKYSIPEIVRVIGAGAFNECGKLTSTAIPDSVTYIGKDAFFRCFGLTSVIIPRSITFNGEYAFSSCRNLKSVTANRNVFSNCHNSKSETIYDSVIRTNQLHLANAFSWQSQLKKTLDILQVLSLKKQRLANTKRQLFPLIYSSRTRKVFWVLGLCSTFEILT